MKIIRFLPAFWLVVMSPTAAFAALDFSDNDGDAIPAFADNCKNVFNPSQLDTDSDLSGDACDEDDDDDGMPDVWELAHGLDTVQASDATTDADGVSNLQEYLADTDPNSGFEEVYDAVYLSSWHPEAKNDWRAATPYNTLDLKKLAGDSGGYLEIIAEGGADFAIGNIAFTGDFTAYPIREISLKVSQRYGSVRNVYFQLQSENSPQGGWRHSLSNGFPNSDWQQVEIQFDPDWTDEQAQQYGWIAYETEDSFSETLRSVSRMMVLGSGRPGLPVALALDDFQLDTRHGAGSEEFVHWIQPGRWQMLSLPCLPERSESDVASVFGDDIAGQYVKDWVVYQYDSRDAGYSRLWPDEKLKSGAVYWMLNSAATPRLIDMPETCSAPVVAETGVCANEQSCFSSELPTSATRPLLSFSGNPFSSAVPVNGLSVTTLGGDCAATGGCNIERAAELGYMHPVLQGYDEDSGGFKMLQSDDVIAPWTGVLSWMLPWADGQQPTLQMRIADE